MCGVADLIRRILPVQLEPSAAWPDDLAAIRKLKAAFYIKVAEGLRKKHGHVCTPTPQWIDVQLKREGFVFRFFIHQQKEIALMAKAGRTPSSPLPVAGACD